MRYTLLCGVAVGICASTVAFAQSPIAPTDAAASDPQDGLQDIVVTAQKREESLQDTPISITALDADSLAKNRISSVADIAYHVPSLSMTPFPNSPNAPRLFIRGIGTGDPQVTTDVSVGVYLDGVYLARSIGLGLDVADIERIEVLRGPQGTLYGRNTTGGAINIVTVKPSEDFQLKQEVSIGNFNALRLKTIINVPLSGSLFAKGSFVLDNRDGFVKNVGVGKDFGAHHKIAGRFDLRWVASNDVTVDYSYDRSESDSTSYYYQLLEAAPGFQGIIPAQTRRLKSASLAAPFLSGNSTTEGHSLTIKVDSPIGELKSISAYRKLNDFAYQDYSANPFISITSGRQRTKQHQISQEVQLVGSTAREDFNYAIGAYFFEEHGKVDLTDNVDLIAYSAQRDVSAVNTAFAGYAQVGWRPGGTSPLSITAGARYSIDDRHANNHIDPRASVSFSKFTPALVAKYEISRTVSVYAKAVTGYKSGGFNLRSPFFDIPFAPETLTSYEFGWKTEWFGRKLRINGAAFYSDYKDIQLDIVVPNQPNPTLTRTENAGRAHIKGFEIDVDALPTRWLRPSLSYSYLKGDVTDVIGDDPSFYRFQNTPRHQISANLDVDVATLPLGTVTVHGDYSRKSSIFTSGRPNPPGSNPPGDFVPAYGLANFRLSLAGDSWFGRGKYEVSAWVKNAFDTDYRIEGQGSFYQLHATRLGVFGEPRMFGLDLRYTY